LGSCTYHHTATTNNAAVVTTISINMAEPPPPLKGAPKTIEISGRKFVNDSPQEKLQSTCVLHFNETSTSKEAEELVRHKFNVPSEHDVHLLSHVHGAPLTGETLGKMGIKAGEKLFAAFPRRAATTATDITTKTRSGRGVRRATFAVAGDILPRNKRRKKRRARKAAPKRRATGHSGASAGAGDIILSQKKIASDTSSFTDLPDLIIVEIATYLPKSSRALLAVALTAPSSEFSKCGHDEIVLSPTSKAIFAARVDDEKEKTYKKVINELLQNDWGIGPDIWGFELYSVDTRLSRYYGDSSWRILDFLDVPCALASNLTDEDLCALLLGIGANNVREVRLTNCLGIIGYGLSPL
jgi:hypothetical protein